jgi:WD40 repeat protein
MKCFAAWNDGPIPQRMDKSAREFGNLGIEVTALAAHPASDVVVLGDSGGSLTLFDPTQGEILARHKGHSKSVTRILFSRDGDHMVSTSTDGAVIVWTGEGDAVHKTEAKGGVLAAAIHPETQQIAFGGMDKRITIWDAFDTGSFVHLPDQTAPSTACCWMADGWLVVGDLAGALWIWDPSQMRLVKRIKAHDQQVNHIIAGRRQDWYASAAWDGNVKIWTKAFRERSVFAREGHQPMGLATTPIEDLLAVGYFDGGMRVWNLKDGQLTDEFSASDQPLASIAATADGASIVTADNTGTVRGWSIGAVGTTRYVHRHAGEVYSVAYTRDNLHLLSVGWDGCLKMWDRQNGSELGYIHVSEKPATSLDVAFDNSFWAIGSADGAIRIWNVAEQSFDALLQSHKLSLSSVKLLGQSDHVLSGSWDNRLSITSIKAQYVDRWFDGHSKEVTSCDVSLDGRRMVSASRDGTIRVWRLDEETEHARPQFVLNPHAGSVFACAISPDGRSVAGGYADHAVRIWSAERPSEAMVLEGHQDEATACRFTPDGKLLVTADRSGLVCFWDASNAMPLGTLLHEAPILCLGISPDGAQAAIGDSAGFVRFMDLEYPADPPWITATIEHRSPSLWRLGSPAVESWRACCIYCGASQLVDKGTLGKRWKCPKCRHEMQVCPRAAAALARV